MRMASSTMQATLIRADSLVASPWKNGGGVTREIAAHPSGERAAGAAFDTFAWRVSVADVAQPGPFSRFDGIDRTLVLLAGAGMTLVEPDGARHVLRAPLDRVAFAGETALAAELHDGPTRDFNLMTRRDAARGSVDAWRGGGAAYALRAHAVLLFCASGAPVVDLGDGAPIALNPFDTLRLDDPANGELRCAIHGDGALLAVGVTLLHDKA
ncbi:HutD family protein [Burkholderia oklahomensis]|uniref:HutD/Ves family protein n=1 Tax=Burkholderia oklahomensis TaxID=342113 RepID=UPI000473EE34|nr:HutD family protein [Burkholderia oklahomensis]AJX32705.1 hutD family protein [Burkholderia oklahomensis C6786]AOI45437.1 histidine utilization protein HutD [Burkholderia oklahomensis C6786]KUY63682.1 histidine utilization protein HutD [Burkholderia oklahomensis C6786]MBI0358483.1 HutD family protein [Burkholderia oklahomensis]SUW56649.1 Various environmental stresses-induced protein [Burkholderia oklahomensis]